MECFYHQTLFGLLQKHCVLRNLCFILGHETLARGVCRFCGAKSAISMLSRALLYPINTCLAPCPVIRNPSAFIWLSVKGYHPCWAHGPRALSPPYECVNEWLWVCNIKGFETSWWFWLLMHGHKSPACTWRTHMQLMSPKRCSSPQKSAFGTWFFFDRFDLYFCSGTNADSCVRLANSTAMMSTKRTRRSVSQSHWCYICTVSWQKREINNVGQTGQETIATNYVLLQIRSQSFCHPGAQISDSLVWWSG